MKTIMPGDTCIVKVSTLSFWRDGAMHLAAKLHANDIVIVIAITKKSNRSRSRDHTLFCMTKFGVLERPIPNLAKLGEWIERIA